MYVISRVGLHAIFLLSVRFKCLNPFSNLKFSKLIPYLTIIPIAIGIHSCEIINPEEGIPSYIHINSIQLQINDSIKEGSSSHKITDAWIFIDDELLGAYELPVTFPVLKEGKHILKIKAGIKVNGIANTRDQYPFYDFFTENINLIKGSTIEVSPVIEYYNTTVFKWIEDFDSVGISLEPESNSDTTINIINASSLVFEGTGSGELTMNSNMVIAEVFTSTDYQLPNNKTPVYLEFNYKNNFTFVVGIYSNLPSQSIQKRILWINTSDEWNKIYIDLTTDVSAETTALDYKIFFGVNNINNASPKIYLDNIKLVHY